jgi:hypothetical protein
MALNLVKGEIKIIMETLSEQINTISRHQGKIPQIEVDIIMANIRKLYERFSDLNDLNDKRVAVKTDILFTPEPEDQLETEEIPVLEEKPVIETEIIIKPVITEKKIEAEEKITETVDKPLEIPLFEEKPEPQKEVKPTLVELPKKMKPEKPTSSDLFSTTEKEIVADKFKVTPKSVHEKFTGEKNDKTVAGKIGKSSIPSMKSAIGINDKFLFINQLFKGDLHEYNNCIDRLNACDTIDVATKALEELKEAHNWNNGDEAYQKLEDLVIRKLL